MGTPTAVVSSQPMAYEDYYEPNEKETECKYQVFINTQVGTTDLYPTIPVNIPGLNVNALLNTGAFVSLISIDHGHKLPGNKDPKFLSSPAARM